MTIQQSCKQHLDQFAIFESDIDKILDEVKADPANKDLTDRWHEDVSNYPPVIASIARMTAQSAAVTYFERENPMAWFLPALRQA